LAFLGVLRRGKSLLCNWFIYRKMKQEKKERKKKGEAICPNAMFSQLISHSS